MDEIKRDRKVGINYMHTWERERMIKAEGREEGRAEGRVEGRVEGQKEGLKTAICNMAKHNIDISYSIPPLCM